MKILLAASEVAPIIKLGGLGDVIGSLPKALEQLGVDADVIVPFFSTANISGIKIYRTIELHVPFGNDSRLVEIYKTKLPGSNVDVHLLKNEDYFHLGGESAFLNNIKEAEMFSFFSKAVVEYIKARFNTYDLVHCHDWHTGLITHLLVDELGKERPATVFTIHNLFYQGLADEGVVKEAGIAPGSHPLIDYDIKDHNLNLLYQGITSSDWVTTVSESYADEIKTRTFGGRLSQTMVDVEHKLTGILNGIDYASFPRLFNKRNWDGVKSIQKEELQEKLKLRKNHSSPLFSFISRLDPGQKGLDILYVSIAHIINNGGQFVILGKGDTRWERKFEELSHNRGYKNKLIVKIGFDSKLANDIYSASDFFIVPSKYEPCGLTQMIAMHYGTVPIVRSVGGLKDTVINGENGFSFSAYSSLELNRAIDRALETYSKKDVHKSMIEACLDRDFSWGISAQKYADLYTKVIESHNKTW